MWDYNKLFAEGNVVGLKNLLTDECGVYQITKNQELPIEAQCGYSARWNDFKNERLARSINFIQYIIRLDEHGNIVEKLFDREKVMPKPMPELKTGMFVKIYSAYRNESILAFIYDNRVIYQDGEWDAIYDLTKDVVMEVYSSKALCFNNCQEPYLLWRNPKYQPN